jgi:hypothetical protein
MQAATQRILNDLQRAKLSRCHMIWLLLYLTPPPPPPVSKLDRRRTERLRKRHNFPTGEWGEGGVLCKLFSTLWVAACILLFQNHQSYTELFA